MNPIARRLLPALCASALTLAGGYAEAQSGSGGERGRAESPDAEPAEAAADAPRTRVLIATVITRNDRGRVFCALWRGREGFATNRHRAIGRAIVRHIVNRRARCVFRDVSPGEYAVAAFHDENANNDLDRNIFGIPTEGTGASNNARGTMGPPGYDDARFHYPDVWVHRIRFRIDY